MDDFIRVWWPLLLPLVIAFTGAVATGVFTIWNRKGENKDRQHAPLPPTWPEMWARIDALEKRNERLEERVEALEKENQGLRDQKAEIVKHVVMLENMITEPPPRPTWTGPNRIVATGSP